jgi:hypothetical protein
VVAALLTLLIVARTQAEEGTTRNEEPTMHTAGGRFDVKLTPVDTGDDQLGMMTIAKTFEGDLVATSVGRMLTAMTAVRGSAGYVAVERVTGVLAGKQGSFTLQHTGTMDAGKPSLEITVVPDSGTGELTGLRGTMGIDIRDGDHFYTFEYRFEAREQS